MTNESLCLPVMRGVGSKFAPGQKLDFGDNGYLEALFQQVVQGFVSGQTVEVVDDNIGVDQVTHQFQPSRADAK